MSGPPSSGSKLRLPSSRPCVASSRTAVPASTTATGGVPLAPPPHPPRPGGAPAPPPPRPPPLPPPRPTAAATRTAAALASASARAAGARDQGDVAEGVVVGLEQQVRHVGGDVAELRDGERVQ